MTERLITLLDLQVYHEKEVTLLRESQTKLTEYSGLGSVFIAIGKQIEFHMTASMILDDARRSLAVFKDSYPYAYEQSTL